MSDTTKPPPSPPKTEASPEKKPLENPKVNVRVVPAKKNDREYAEKVKRNLKTDVEKTVRENEGGGAKKQLESAEKTVRGVGTQVDPNKIREISVDVSGKVGKTKIAEETVVKPGAAPASAPSPAKPDDGKKK